MALAVFALYRHGMGLSVNCYHKITFSSKLPYLLLLNQLVFLETDRTGVSREHQIQELQKKKSCQAVEALEFGNTNSVSVQAPVPEQENLHWRSDHSASGYLRRIPT
jgi:hypothetical protein